MPITCLNDTTINGCQQSVKYTPTLQGQWHHVHAVNTLIKKPCTLEIILYSHVSQVLHDVDTQWYTNNCHINFTILYFAPPPLPHFENASATNVLSRLNCSMWWIPTLTDLGLHTLYCRVYAHIWLQQVTNWLERNMRSVLVWSHILPLWSWKLQPWKCIGGGGGEGGSV